MYIVDLVYVHTRLSNILCRCQYMYVYFYSLAVLSKCMASKLCFGYLLFSLRTRSLHICRWPVACGLSDSPRAPAQTAPRRMAEWNSDMEVDVLYRTISDRLIDMDRHSFESTTDGNQMPSLAGLVLSHLFLRFRHRQVQSEPWQVEIVFLSVRTWTFSKLMLWSTNREIHLFPPFCSESPCLLLVRDMQILWYCIKKHNLRI